MYKDYHYRYYVQLNNGNEYEHLEFFDFMDKKGKMLAFTDGNKILLFPIYSIAYMERIYVRDEVN